MNKKTFNQTAICYIIIVLLAILLAFDYQLFIVNNGFAPAGLNGIATMIQYKTGFSIGYMSIIINIPLCILAYFFLERSFAVRSLTFCLVYSFTFLFLQKLGLENFQYNADGHDTIYPVIISGLLSGIVYGFCFRSNSSTGGTDIVSKYINHKIPSLNFFWVTFTLNVVVAIISFFVYAEVDSNGITTYNYKPVCLCITYCFVSSYMGNKIIKGTKTAYRFTIITTHPEEIMHDIQTILRHSSTKVNAEGSYSHGDKSLIVCVINKHQLLTLKDILAKYDSTFSFSETVNETYGNFKKIK